MWLTMLVCCGFFVTADADGIVATRNVAGPVTLQFQRQSGPAGGRTSAYDPATQMYHLQVRDIARFEVQAVSEKLAEQPVVLHIAGMLDKPEGPLEMEVPHVDPQKTRRYSLHHVGYDKRLFRITRKENITTIEFLPAGKALLKPGVRFHYIDFFRG